MIGDVVIAKKLWDEYRVLKIIREAGYGRELVEGRIATLLMEMWTVEERLLAEGLALNSEGELVNVTTGMRVAVAA